MTDIRERAAKLRESLDCDTTEKDEGRFVDFALSERAAALGAAKKAIVELRYDNPSQPAEECAWDDALGDAYRAVDTLSPESWLGVRAWDLAIVKEAAANGAARLEEIAERGVFPEAANQLATAIRAALARLP